MRIRIRISLYGIIKSISLLLSILSFILFNYCQAEERLESEKIEAAFHVQDTDINTLLKALALRNQVNIVSTPGVKGRISLDLRNAGVEDTLTAISKSAGLSWSKEGSVYIVSEGTTPQEGGTKIIKTFKINYADLNELSKIIQWSFEKVRVNNYNHERILLVDGESDKFPLIEKLIASLDIPPQQALIEAKILEINLSDDTSYGLDWGDTFSQGQHTTGQINSPGPQLPPNPSDPVAKDTARFFFGLARPSLYLKLNAMQKKGDVKTLATPRLMVLDGQPAQIIIGGRIGYYITTTTETSTLQSVEFLDIGTQLKLTPKITQDGHIILNIHPEVSDGALSDGLPHKTTTAVTTSIMVKAGETIFIGGLIRDSKVKNEGRLPILSRIPLLGPLFFSSYSTQVQGKELVILLTPYLVSGDQNLGYGQTGIGEKLPSDINKWQEQIEGLKETK